MAKKINLPLLSDPGLRETPKKPAAKKPSIEAARSRLGGRADEGGAPPPGFAPGVVVTFALPSGRRRAGVLVFANAYEAHVLLDGVRLRRLSPAELALHGSVPEELAKLAADARLFGLLVEGQSIRYANDKGSLLDGKLIEKCRWGALVLRDDGGMVAVGFRKLWPTPTAPST